VKDWSEIIERAILDAKRGDTAARKWLSDYLMGTPIQRLEHTGAGGGIIELLWTSITSGESQD
jgi:hypothetical protein